MGPHWHKDSLKGSLLAAEINIFLPEAAKGLVAADTQDVPEIFTKFSSEKGKEWNDVGLVEMLSKYADLADLIRPER